MKHEVNQSFFGCAGSERRNQDHDSVMGRINTEFVVKDVIVELFDLVPVEILGSSDRITQTEDITFFDCTLYSVGVLVFSP